MPESHHPDAMTWTIPPRFTLNSAKFGLYDTRFLNENKPHCNRSIHSLECRLDKRVLRPSACDGHTFCFNG